MHGAGVESMYFREFKGSGGPGPETVPVVDASEFPKEPQCDLGFRATAWILRLDAGTSIDYSYDGTTVHGRIYKADKFIVKDEFDAAKVWLRVPAGNPATVRVWAWLKQR